MIKLRFYHPRGNHYPSVVLRFSLLLRYTSNSAYKFLNKFIPLPSERLLKKLNLHTIDSSKALCTLRNKSLIGNDVVILLDEIRVGIGFGFRFGFRIGFGPGSGSGSGRGGGHNVLVHNQNVISHPVD